MRFSLIFLIVIVLFPLMVSFCAAAARPLEWPIPGMGATTDLPNYIKAVFNFVMGLAGGLAGIMLIVGFIRYLTSAGSPERIGEAKKTIFAALFGLFFILSSVIIIRVINTDLDKLGVHQIDPITLDGVYLTGGGKKVPCPVSVFDIKELDPELTNLLIDCPEGETWTYIFTKYPELGLQGQSTTTVLTCGGGSGVGATGSFKIQRKWPGVYIYKDSGCQDMDAATRLTGSIRVLTEYKKDTINCLEIFNEGNIKYGLILFGNPEFKSEWNTDPWWNSCDPYVNPGKVEVSLKNYSSIAIFQLSPSPTSAGSEVVFYSKAHYQGMPFVVKNTQLTGGASWWDAKDMKFQWTNEDEWGVCNSSDTGWTATPWHIDECAGSVRIAGQYIVLLRSWDNDITSNDDFFCQLFAWKNPEGSAPPPGMEDVSNATNLAGEYLMSEGCDGLHDMFIIPAASL